MFRHYVTSTTEKTIIYDTYVPKSKTNETRGFSLKENISYLCN